MQEANRPWVEASRFGVGEDVNKNSINAGHRPEAVFYVVNTGGSPAVDILIAATASFEKAVPLSMPNIKEEARGPYVAFPRGDPIREAVPTGVTLSPEDEAAWRAEHLFLVVAVHISYKDIFGRPHHTTICHAQGGSHRTICYASAD